MGPLEQFRRARPVGLALALVLVLAQLGGLLHRAAVEHVACAEHGEQIHGASSGSVEGPATHPREHQLRRDVSGELAADHGHEHCGLVASQKVQGPATPAWAMALVPQGEARPVLLPAAPAPRGGLYRIAPKNSPPFAA